MNSNTSGWLVLTRNFVAGSHPQNDREIIEGIAAAGMTFEVPEVAHQWRMKVKAVEFVLLAGGKERIGLVVENDRCLRGSSRACP